MVLDWIKALPLKYCRCLESTVLGPRLLSSFGWVGKFSPVFAIDGFYT